MEAGKERLTRDITRDATGLAKSRILQVRRDYNRTAREQGNGL